MVGVTTTLLLGTVLLLGWMSSKKVKEVATEDFNQQQLAIAKHAADQIENSLNSLKRELSLLSLSPSIQYMDKVFMSKRMDITFSRIKEEGGLEIRYISSSYSKSYVVDHLGFQTAALCAQEKDVLRWGAAEENRGHILISDISPISSCPSLAKVVQGDSLIMKMMLPVWQVSVDETHPVATRHFSGVLVFVVDTTCIKRTINGIRSGKTGYAWVIDNSGIFLYHPETDFIGKNAFEARREKRPTISFARINAIQKEMMLAGKEGMSWYISGWHRGQEGEIKKLIAYAPIHLDAEEKNRIWSVAVVAPISEVEGAIHDIQIRQFILEGVVVLIILSGGLLILSIMLRWSSSLKKEVEIKTNELKKSEGQCRSLVDTADDIIFTVGRKGDFLSMNRYGHHFFIRKGEETLGSDIEALFPGESGALLMKTIQGVFDTNTSRQETCSVMVDGKEYWLSTNFSGLLDENGEVFAVLGIARDITERKKMEDQMFYTEKLASIGTLAAGVAHEINNPLAIILGFADLMLEKTPKDSEVYEILKTIERQGTNAKRVVENLLSFTRFSEHKEKDVDVNMNIKTVLAVIGNTLWLNKIIIHEDLSESLPLVKGDPGELQQVFFNIINNAVSAMKSGGILTITTRAVDEGKKVEIRISDTGSGIDKDHRTRIFDPLFTTKKVGEGTGLGLFVSYGIITKHEGTIHFETRTKEESEESGTTFTIVFPAINS